MTPAQQQDLSQQFQRYIKRYEAIYSPKFNAALKSQIQQYIDSGTLMAITSDQIYKVLLEVYENSASVWAHKSMLNTRRLKGRQPMGFSKRINELMKKHFGIDLLNIAQQITETTKKVIGEILSSSVADGESFNEITAKLQAQDLTKIRARLIARTEVVSSANAAAVIAAKETAAVTGLGLRKMWIATQDHRTRKDHSEVDQQVIGVDDSFIVGGFRMTQPGDRTQGAPASEICNCRCCVAMVAG